MFLSNYIVPISSIREVRCVHTSEVLGQGTSSVPTSGAGVAAAVAVAASTTSSASSASVGVGSSTSSLDWTFSIIHGDDFSSLDLIASSAEEATIWVTGLNALLGTHLCKYFSIFFFILVVSLVCVSVFSHHHFSGYFVNPAGFRYALEVLYIFHIGPTTCRSLGELYRVLTNFCVS